MFDKDTLEILKRKTTDVVNRSLDQHINLAVTGLSRSGKTAFITSLVNQLITENSDSKLSFFDVVHQGRYIAAKRVPQKHKEIPRFDYDGAISALSQTSAQWPKPTDGISELRIAIKYKPDNSLLKYATDTTTLNLDITDYPGEWLLDLPILNQTFEEWSALTTNLLHSEPRHTLSASFIDKVAQLSPFEPVDENLLAELSKEYTELLVKFRYDLGLSVIQPGRFILPGDLANAPVLQFFPFTQFEKLDLNAYQKAGEDTLIGMLRARFLAYKETVVKRFYKSHFVNFDRQIILADCLTPLNKGQDSFTDLQLALEMINESFNYGKSGLLSRLFSPKIDKLLFVATKADHITPDQHENLVSLLEQLVATTKQQLTFENIDLTTMAIASIKSTKAGKGSHQGETIPVIQGNKMVDNSKIVLFPGSVPASIPSEEYWQQHPFNFVDFAPQPNESTHNSLPHLRMDKVLNFLLGDKLK